MQLCNSITAFPTCSSQELRGKLLEEAECSAAANAQVC